MPYFSRSLLPSLEQGYVQGLVVTFFMIFGLVLVLDWIFADTSLVSVLRQLSGGQQLQRRHEDEFIARLLQSLELHDQNLSPDTEPSPFKRRRRRAL